MIKEVEKRKAIKKNEKLNLADLYIQSKTASSYNYDYIPKKMRPKINLADEGYIKAKTKAKYTYDAFGNLIKTKEKKKKADTSYLFSTKEQDKTGLIYFGARYYNSTTGRFLTPDPLGMVNGPNLYTYVNNNPVNYIDLWGLEKKKKWQKEVPWWERFFWEPSEERRAEWEWKKNWLHPPESWISAGYVGPVDVHWRNQRHYEQWGRWVWNSREYERKWEYRWGKKVDTTSGYVYPMVPYHLSGVITPKPQDDPEP